MTDRIKMVTLVSAILVLFTGGACASSGSEAASVQHSAQASEHLSLAGAHASTGGAKFTAGVAAVPLLVVGEIGKGAGATGEVLWENANSPLEISEQTIVAGPPPKAPDLTNNNEEN